MQLDGYQERFISDIGSECKNHRAILAQLETGGGKTVIFSTIANRYLSTSKKDVIIFVDSESIFNQTRKTLFNWYKIDSDVINAKSAHIKRNSLFGTPRVFVAMVETFDRRASRDSFLNQVKDVGLVIVDECHMGNFIKIFEHFPQAIRIGFTATPVSSDKKKPLRNYYDTIVCGPTTSDLIDFNKINQLRGLVPVVTFSLTSNISRKELEQEELKLGYKGEDFNQELVGSKLSGKRQIQNTIDAYVDKALGKKMICFNANISHSEAVTKDMIKYGLPARHLDSNCGDEYKKELYDWFHKTEGAILCNVGMTTKGFDEPSCEGVITNTMTKSIVKYRQMVGRGARPYKYPDGRYKEHNIHLDMCDNVLGGGHGQWSDDIDWEYIFENPKLPRPGVAPSKECPECGFLCAASARICSGLVEDFFSGNGDMMKCGFEFPIKEISEDTVERELVLISKDIDVSKIINFPKFQGRGEYLTFYETIRSCAYYTRQKLKYDLIEREEFEQIWQMTHSKIREWQTIKGRMTDGRKKRDNEWYSTEGRKKLLTHMREYGFIVNLVEENVTV